MFAYNDTILLEGIVFTDHLEFAVLTSESQAWNKPQTSQ